MVNLKHITAAALLLASSAPSALAQSAPPFVQDSINWCSSQLPPGGWFRISGIQATDTAHYWPVASDHMSAWTELPNQFYITFARAMHNAAAVTSGNGGQFVVGLDRDHIAYRTGAPPEHQNGDNSHWFPLASVFNAPNEPQERTQHWNPPVFFDKTRDGLWFEMDTNVMETACFEIGVLYAAPGVPPPVF